LGKRDLFKKGAIALEALSETTDGDADDIARRVLLGFSEESVGTPMGDVASLVSQGGNPYRTLLPTLTNWRYGCAGKTAGCSSLASPTTQFPDNFL